ncbi:MAG: hypothetical protein JXA14_22735 [Anaerolineae bacterium]|nr:hypothetical protein [Anaerolineae bacterium]
MKKIKNLWKVSLQRVPTEAQHSQSREKGQSIVLLAVMMIVLLLFAGMAIDAGLIYMRRVQLSRAVDAAALACVKELPNMDATRNRAWQFMEANGLDPEDVLIASGGYFTVTKDNPQDVPPGVGQDHIATVYARWRSRTVFMQLIGFNYVDLEAEASAEFRAYVDVFSSQTGESGKMGPVNLSVFGPDQTPSYGDACSCPVIHQGSEGSDYRPTVEGGPDNPNREQSCWSEGAYPFRVHVPGGVDEVRLEILDPETYNTNSNSTYISKTLPYSTTESTYYTFTGNKAVRINPAMRIWFDSDINGDRYWTQRIDEIRLYNNSNPSYNDDYSTETEFQLYYIGDGERINLVTYIGRKDNLNNTDLTWVCPGGRAPQDPQYGGANVTMYGSSDGKNYYLTPNPSFEIDMTKLSGIEVGDGGSRSLFLSVKSLTGWSENGFDLWAGPATDENINYWGGEKANVNYRNVWIDRRRAPEPDGFGEKNPHDSAGVVVYGLGILPLNVNADTEYEVTLAYIPEVARNVPICVYKWDTDIGSKKICYWFDGYPIPNAAGSNCDEGEVEGTLSKGNSWTIYDNNYDRLQGCDLITVPTYFAGGYLHARYEMGAHDTSVWLMEYQQPVPGYSYVRLIQ